MILIIYAAFAMVLGVSLGASAYASFGAQQAYLGLYKGIFERHVVVADYDGTYLAKPYFDMEGLRQSLHVYFLNNLSPYCSEYDYALQVTEDYGPDRPTGLKLDLHAKYAHLFEHTYSAYFSIERSQNG